MKTESLTAKLSELTALSISAADETRLWRKFQLEWNYHSNHIEGNTLTYGETELLLVHHQITGTHDLRDIEEMKAHDLAITHLRQLAKDEQLITEGDIRDLNKTLLKEPFFKKAITADGQPTRKQIIPGEYKTTPNNVIQADGSLFEFTAPSDVAAKMQELVDWLRKELETPSLHPIELATFLHHRFVLIHPFDDGNGRTARLLANYVLLRSGYPPVIVKTETKSQYIAALRQADAGDTTPLLEFLGKELDWSLTISIKAAKGESIAEENDLDKEVAIFVKNQTDVGKDVVPKSKEVIGQLAETSFYPLFGLLTSKVEKFAPLFVSTSLKASPPSPGGNDDIAKCFRYLLSQNNFNGFSITIRMSGYKGDAPQPFDLQHTFAIKFTKFEYLLTYQNVQQAKHLYSEPILQEDINTIIAKVQATIFAEIKKKSGQS